MPPSGPGAIATFGPRLGAVVIDWVLSLLISRGLFGVPLPFTDPPPQVVRRSSPSGSSP